MDRQAIRSFNTVSERFISAMIETFPNNRKLKVYDMKYRTSKKIDVATPVRVYYEMLGNSGAYIMNKDIMHFKENEAFENELGILEKWHEYTPELKNTIWDYIQSLYILCMTSMGKKDTVVNIVKSNKKETTIES